MNEERSKEESGGLSHAKTRIRGGEFAQNLGEVVHRGDKVFAVPPSGPPIPVGIAPPLPLQVQSVFDTRPIAAYDFCFSAVQAFGNEGPATFSQSIDVPAGYSAVLRRVEFAILPIFIGSVALFTTGNGELAITLLRDGVAIPNNTALYRGTVTAVEWKTHQVFGFWESFGLQAVISGTPISGAIATTNYSGEVRFYGTLIPSRSYPAQDEIASGPVLTREYVQLQLGDKP